MNFDEEEYISDDYNPDDYEEEPVKENKFIKGIIDNSLDKKGFKFNKSVDVRIILTSLDYIESISSTINNFDLSNFNVVISSIIPTTDFEIAKSTTQGADLLLIATEFNEEGKKLFYKLKNHLKTDYNYIEYLKLPDSSKPKYDSYNYRDEEDLGEFFEDEIANSIIRAGLSCVSNLSVINHSKLKFFQIKDDFDKTSAKLEKTNSENANLENDIKTLRSKNEDLTEKVLTLQKELDKLKSDYSTYKSRFENIYSKDSLEIFDLATLWEELFEEFVNEELYKAIIIATDEFKPTDLIVGQGFIGAKTKEDAMDWLKIIKTALIVNFKDFKPSNDSGSSTTRSTIGSTTYGNSYNNNSYSQNNYSSESNRNNYDKYDDDELDKAINDADNDNSVSNAFSNLW